MVWRVGDCADPKFVRHFKCLSRPGSVARQFKCLIKLKVKAGSPQLIVSAWSKHPQK
jgi:hypothetical protein